ncbi:MAG: proton-conducting transporter membrane subunit, partial [Chloroflexota bacterium]
MYSILSWILFVPSFAAILILLLPSDNKKLVRWTALLTSLIPLALSLVVWFGFDAAPADADGLKYVVNTVWYKAIGSNYHIGLDGLSLTMLLLTTLLTPLAILASFTVDDRVNMYMALFLFLETGMLGVFLAQDLLIFFVFWEIGLVPMYFLINQWGSPKGERELWNGMKVANRTYASFKFIIFTMAGSLGLLLAVQMMGVMFGTFDLPEIIRLWNGYDRLNIL